ncbi:2-amino-4-hydroxy-6-hydroxymethyldihydropteridine diphosphokinase [Alkalicoccobacillus gibsonii]|jgi:2-amino-4-hydroxy-6-hydroxymethyldihydropteridine diphosphokinase|uniref:2-amino-4-hydroxy-6- hydroxymethyldihydropteridine diphosphokinase n=1 Tax=Alkalicoccobacillus gibsonii TaxID=79881 RepID=UPI0019340A79|nr:2-amino-4-hydroxy-6-hydroxymethyldihydropteridine diphosphokinase [Alkalicoccobacillus gibsonii]MBM0067749.1 2-amino-4-hydroxy-6-hydroxymethyldihydropteridine diphosphokinase [Alkalicoccobacillus gibsonii]
MANVYLSLGSNMESRIGYLEKAISKLRLMKDSEVTAISSIYETDPVGYIDQPSFLNLVVCLKTTLPPFELLAETQQIENELGRKREIRWGPRTIDLDILLYDQENMKMESLTLPHPRMWQRSFVIIPLLEVAPNLSFDVQGVTLKQVYDQLQDKEGVRMWKP